MKRIPLLVSVLALVACDADSSDALVDRPITTDPRPTLSDEEIAYALDAIRAEPAVLAARYEPQNMVEWIVAVEDDGNSRIGYASYICLLLVKAGVVHPGTEVRIVDHSKLLQNDDDYRSSSLGRVNCFTDVSSPV